MVLERLKQELNQRAKSGVLRQLKLTDTVIDFASNDYLGLSKSGELAERSQVLLNDFGSGQLGSAGSRLLTGNKPIHELAEQEFSKFFKAEKSLLFPSGYAANVGLFSTLVKRTDTVIYDEYAHASIRDGIQMCAGKSLKFKHNSVSDLEQKLSKVEGLAFVVVESIYSMDGDVAPISEMLRVCKSYKAHLIVDEAHASGLYGDNGEGYSVELDLQDEIFARVFTFGKTFGSQGAVIAGSTDLIDYLINFCRTFIYTTAPSEHDVALMLAAIQIPEKLEAERSTLSENISYFRRQVEAFNLPVLKSESQIQGILTKDNKTSEFICSELSGLGIDARPIKSPTVPEGLERIRLCIHSYNTTKEIDSLITSISKSING